MIMSDTDDVSNTVGLSKSHCCFLAGLLQNWQANTLTINN